MHHAAARGSSEKLKIAILQRVCPEYRVSLFTLLSAAEDAEVKLFIGEDLPSGKVRNAPNLSGVNVTRLRTRFIRIGHRIFPWHAGLVGRLREYQPDVILCEGESHFLGYLQAILYRSFFSRRTALLHWCFIALPGEPRERRDLAFKVKVYFRKHFDGFVVYSSYSQERLIELGEPRERIFVAANVGDVRKFVAASENLRDQKYEARQKLGLPENFTVLYSGTLDPNKHPEVLIKLASMSSGEQMNFVLLGSGPMLEEMKRRVHAERLANVFFPGRVTDDLALYYRAADAMILPGRGGIVMSEAMAMGLPVVVHEADGTEYDLVVPEITGFRVQRGDANDFARALDALRTRPNLVAEMSRNCQQLVRNRFNEVNMASQILAAARYAWRARNTRASAHCDAETPDPSRHVE